MRRKIGWKRQLIQEKERWSTAIKFQLKWVCSLNEGNNTKNQSSSGLGVRFKCELEATLEVRSATAIATHWLCIVLWWAHVVRLVSRSSSIDSRTNWAFRKSRVNAADGRRTLEAIECNTTSWRFSGWIPTTRQSSIHKRIKIKAQCDYHTSLSHDHQVWHRRSLWIRKLATWKASGWTPSSVNSRDCF